VGLDRVLPKDELGGDLGAVVHLVARAAGGSAFAGWSGACAGTGPCDVSMGAERSVTAAFVAAGPPAAPAPAGPGPTSQPAPSGAANASVRDRAAPRLRGVSLRPRRLRAARRGATIAALATGATLRYALSERGALSIAIERAGTRGRYQALPGALRRATTAGAHRLTFRARLRGRPLRAGRYRLVLRATDAAGNRSAARRLIFTVAVGR